MSSIDFIKKSIKFSFTSVISFMISILTVPIMTRLYAPEQLGHINMFNTVSSFCFYFALFGFDQSFFRFYNEPPKNISIKNLFTYCINITAIIFSILIVVLYFFRNDLSQIISDNNHMYIFMLICINIFAMVIIRYSSLIFLLEQKALYYSIQGLLVIVASKLVAIIIGFVRPDYFSVLVVMNIVLLIMSLMYLINLRKMYDFNCTCFDMEVIKNMAYYSLPLMPLTVISWFNDALSNLVLRKNLGFHEVGIYSSGVSVASLISIVQVGFNTYWGTYVYANYKTDNHRIQMVNRYITFLLVTFAILIMIFQDLIYIIIGPKYFASKLFFSFLIVSPICLTISDTTGIGIGISKKSYLHLISTSASAISNLVLCLLLLPIMGIAGAAVSAATSSLIMLVLRTYIGEKYYKCVQNYNLLIFTVFVLVFSSIISYLFNDSAIIRLALLTPLFLIMIKLYNKEAIKIITDLKQIIYKFYAERIRV